jgi:adenylate cyclase
LPSSVDLAALIDDVIGTARLLAEQNGNSLTIDIDADLGALMVDPLRLRQILLNLLSNACKFTKQGAVTLRARSIADGRGLIEFAVADTGIGMTQGSRASCSRNSPRPMPRPRGATAEAGSGSPSRASSRA